MNYLLMGLIDIPSLIILIFALIGLITVLRFIIKGIVKLLKKS
jgi:hypothetical protein